MRVSLQLNGLTRLRKALESTADSVHIQTMLKNWGMRYMAEQQELFADNSRGGGSWVGLAEATIAGKKRKGSRTPTTILRDRSILFHALNPINQALGPGQYRQLGPLSIEIGIGGSGTYPSGVAIAEVARVHHMGEGRMPKRVILNPVSAQVRAGMIIDANNALSKINE